MALSGSFHGSSSLRTTEDRNKLDQNFGNEIYSPEFDAYMSTDIGNGQRNYDNYYINGIYTGMNVAKTSYHTRGRGNKVIFGVCRGTDDDDGAFEASRSIFEYLDECRGEILEGKTLSAIKKNLRRFADNCNARLMGDTRYKNHGVSLLVVVYALSGAVCLSCGSCTLFRVDKNNNCKSVLNDTEFIGKTNSFNCTIKTIPFFLNSDFLLTTNASEQMRTEKFALTGETDVKSRVESMMTRLTADNPDASHTCLMVSENGSKTISNSTKITAAVCAVITAVSIINMLIQGIPTA